MTELRDIEHLHGRIRTVLAYLDAPVLIVNTNYKTAYINPSFEKTFGVVFKDALGKDIAHYLPPSATETLVVAGEKVRETATSHRMSLHEANHFLTVVVSAITEEGSKVTGIVYSFTDVTRERELERVKAEFITMLLNDLHGPVFEILEIFKRFELGINRKDPHFAMAEKGEARAQEMLDNLERLLHITDSISGEMRLDKTENDIGLLVASAIMGISDKAAKAKVKLMQFQSLLPMVKCDQDKILQVIIHFLNAQIGAAGQGKTVSVSVYPSSSVDPLNVMVVISQTGKTMLQGDFPEIFATEDERPDSCDPGCLAVAKIIEAHGGSITLAGVENMGCSLVVTLPVK